MVGFLDDQMVHFPVKSISQFATLSQKAKYYHFIFYRTILHCAENLKQIFPKMNLRVPNFYIHNWERFTIGLLSASGLSPEFSFSHAIQINRDSKTDISIRFSPALHFPCVVCGEETTNIYSDMFAN
jgi:hypothetical protein